MAETTSIFRTGKASIFTEIFLKAAAKFLLSSVPSTMRLPLSKETADSSPSPFLCVTQSPVSLPACPTARRSMSAADTGSFMVLSDPGLRSACGSGTRTRLLNVTVSPSHLLPSGIETPTRRLIVTSPDSPSIFFRSYLKMPVLPVSGWSLTYPSLIWPPLAIKYQDELTAFIFISIAVYRSISNFKFLWTAAKFLSFSNPVTTALPSLILISASFDRRSHPGTSLRPENGPYRRSQGFQSQF